MIEDNPQGVAMPSDRGEEGATALSPLAVELVCTVLRLLNMRGMSPKEMCTEFELDPASHVRRIGDLTRFHQARLSEEMSGHSSFVANLIPLIISKYKNDAQLRPILPLIDGGRVHDGHIVADAIQRVFKLSPSHLSQCSNYLSGTYLLHRYSKEGGDRITSELLSVLPHDESIGAPYFTVMYKRRGRNTIYNKHGYIIPIRREFFVLCDVSDRKGDGYTEPSFTVLKHPVVIDYSYMRGVYLDTDADGYPWSSQVYMTKVDHADHDVIGSRKLKHYGDEFACRIKAVLGEGPISVYHNPIDASVQDVLAHPLKYVLER